MNILSKDQKINSFKKVFLFKLLFKVGKGFYPMLYEKFTQNPIGDTTSILPTPSNLVLKITLVLLVNSVIYTFNIQN